MNVSATCEKKLKIIASQDTRTVLCEWARLHGYQYEFEARHDMSAIILAFDGEGTIKLSQNDSVCLVSTSRELTSGVSDTFVLFNGLAYLHLHLSLARKRDLNIHGLPEFTIDLVTLAYQKIPLTEQEASWDECDMALLERDVLECRQDCVSPFEVGMNHERIQKIHHCTEKLVWYYTGSTQSITEETQSQSPLASSELFINDGTSLVRVGLCSRECRFQLSLSLLEYLYEGNFGWSMSEAILRLMNATAKQDKNLLVEEVTDKQLHKEPLLESVIDSPVKFRNSRIGYGYLCEASTQQAKAQCFGITQKQAQHNCLWELAVQKTAQRTKSNLAACYSMQYIKQAQYLKTKSQFELFLRSHHQRIQLSQGQGAMSMLFRAEVVSM